MKFFLLSENLRTAEQRFCCVSPERDLIAQEEAATGGCAKAPGVKGESPALRDVWTDRCRGREPRGMHVSIITVKTLHTQAKCRASSLSNCHHMWTAANHVPVSQRRLSVVETGTTTFLHRSFISESIEVYSAFKKKRSVNFD